MTAPVGRTLHRLLWADAAGSSFESATINSAIVPAVGLPVRVVLRMFLQAVADVRSITGAVVGGPVVWTMNGDVWADLVAGRRSQISRQPLPREMGRTHQLLGQAGSTYWEVLPHESYFRPLAEYPRPSNQLFLAWCHTLLLLTALDGSERLLNQLSSSAPNSVPFEERRAWRTSLPLPTSVWHWIDFIVPIIQGGAPFPEEWLASAIDAVVASLTELLGEEPSSLRDEFAAERVDVSLRADRGLDFPVRVQAWPTDAGMLPPELRVEAGQLGENLRVKICQLTAHPDWHQLAVNSLHPTQAEVQAIMRQVHSALFHEQGNITESNGAAEPTWDLAVLPEVCVPETEIPEIQAFVTSERRAVFAGCLWRRVRMAVEPAAGTTAPVYFANEAILVVPTGSTEHADPPAVRTFFIRKPNPAHSEVALERSLNALHPSSSWVLLPGRRWYRFVHPRWGDFTVAICSDLLDAAPWNSMRGQLLHLIACAFNTDVSLYEALTWVRAYESYVNVVATNHGEQGGSFAWTPRGGYNKELARFHGQQLLVLADVNLPVRELYNQQQTGVEASIEAHRAVWEEVAPVVQSRYKAPPPGFPSRGL